MSKIIFLDRDGVLNIEKGHYISRPEDFEPNLKAVSFLQKALQKGYQLVVITNQGGIAKGLYTKGILKQVHQKMQDVFASYQVHFTDIYYCPHHSNFGKCLCRKPDSLLIERALHKHKADKTLSFMIGDRPRDVEAAERAGIRGILVESNQSLDSLIEFL